MSLTDRKREEGGGGIGGGFIGGAGLQGLPAVCISQGGVALGLRGAGLWARPKSPPRDKRKGKARPVEKKETQHWLSVMQQVRKVFAAEAPQTRPWFQLDRGGDAWPILLDGLHQGDLFTVRAAQDRRVAKGSDEHRR